MSCAAGEVLTGTCSTESNKVCTPCTGANAKPENAEYNTPGQCDFACHAFYGPADTCATRDETSTCLWKTSSTYNFAAAQAKCQETPGASLASVHTQAENEIIKNLGLGYLGAIESTTTNGVWTWNDGTAWDYTAPMNDGLNSGSETRIIMNSDNLWHDAGANIYPAICRLESEDAGYCAGLGGTMVN